MKILSLLLLLLIGFLLSIQSYSQNVDTIQLRPGPLSGIDCEIRTDSNLPDWSDDDFISNAWTADGNYFQQRSLIKFDLSSIPFGRIIYSAKLSLFCNTISGHHQLHAGANSSYLMRITEPWDQTQVTWETQPATTLEDVVVLPMSEYQTEDYKEIDVTNLIRYSYKNPDSNFGMMIKLISEYAYAAMVFASSNHVDSTKRPLLEIVYSDCSMPIPYFTFESTLIQNEVQFYSASDTATSYFWNFGTGDTSTEQNPIYNFPSGESYFVCVTATNECGSLVSCDTVISCPPINPLFNFNQSDHILQFFPIQPNEINEYYWDFGDGFMSDLISPTHFYYNYGTYNVCLRVKNSCNQESTHIITVIVNSIENYLFGDLIKVFPIPTADRLFISSDRSETNIKDIQLFDLKGTLILNNNSFISILDSKNFSTDLSNITSGIYMLAITTDHNIIKKKIAVIGK
jgi:PKD repeat protein